MKYLFGPVLSRRLGVSLGVDLMPLKFCNMDCIYCEIGKTSNLIKKRLEYVPTEDVINELEVYLNKSPKLDYITFAGCGEPTSHIGLNKIIIFLKENFPQYKVCLITNSTFLDPNKECFLKLDLVMPSLDSADEKVFNLINRPSESVKLKQIIYNLTLFRKKMKGQMWLEIFFVSGVNDTNEQLKKLYEVVKRINPHKIQLNSLDRPSTEGWVEKPSLQKMEQIKEAFLPFNAEIVAKYPKTDFQREFSTNIFDGILSNIKHRPLIKQELANILNINIKDLQKYLKILLKKGKIEFRKRGKNEFIILKR